MGVEPITCVTPLLRAKFAARCAEADDLHRTAGQCNGGVNGTSTPTNAFASTTAATIATAATAATTATTTTTATLVSVATSRRRHRHARPLGAATATHAATSTLAPIRRRKIRDA